MRSTLGWSKAPAKPCNASPRHLALSAFLLYSGQEKRNQNAHFAVVDLDTGSRDLQQCADAVMRLRAEYLWSQEHYDQLSFNFTNGTPAPWRKWEQGFRPVVNGNKVSWQQKATPASDYDSFRKWLDRVFVYAGSASLARELDRVGQPQQVRAGDVFLKGGFPGHAVLVLDVAEDNQGNRVFLLGQSYMPAQQFHVLHGPESRQNPWYPAKSSGTLKTPEWTFDYGDLYRFSSK